MNLTKREYIALEVFKHKDVSVKQAWLLAGDFLEISGGVQSNTHTEEVTTKVVEENTVKTDYNALFLNTIPQETRELEVGQRWFNWFRGVEFIIDSSYLEEDCSFIDSIASSADRIKNKQFLRNGWQWELMLEGESRGDCKRRVLKERKRAKQLPEFKDIAIGWNAEGLSLLGIAVRSTNILRAENIFTYVDLLEKSDSDLLKIKSLGKNLLAEIMEKLSEKGLYLGMLKTNN